MLIKKSWTFVDPDDNPYGGLSMIDNSIEFEYNVYKDLGIATFFWLTMLSLEANKFNEKFYHSYGIGARYYTPIGPLRVDFGFLWMMVDLCFI